jgi:hypothetical protein
MEEIRADFPAKAALPDRVLHPRDPAHVDPG